MRKSILYLLSFTGIMLNAQIAFQPDNLQFCDIDNDGFGIFDLTVQDDIISGGDASFVVFYFENVSDIDDNINSIGDPSSYFNISNPQIIYAKLEDPNTGNFDTTSFSLIVMPSPAIASQIDDFTISEVPFDGVATFDLTSRVDEILAGEDPNSLEVSFFLSQVDAESNINAISNPESYVNGFNFEEIFVGVENVNTFCYVSSLSFILIVLEGSTITIEPENIFINEGDDNGLAIFDLTVNESQMLGDQDPMVYLFTYHTSLEDAENGVNMISSPESYQNIENPQNIFVRLTNNNTSGFARTSFEIETDGVLSVDELEKDNFNVYPIPFNDFLTVSLVNKEPKVLGNIVDINGKEVVSFDISPRDEKTTLALPELSKGIYFMRLVSQKFTVVKKIIKR